MKTRNLTRRRFLEGSALVLGTGTMSACGGSAPGGETTTVAAASPPVPVSAPTAGTIITSLLLRAEAAGTFPYASTVLPLQGQVANGFTLVSPDDGTLRASVISRWPDGSASVMVVAGTATVSAGEQRTLRLQLAASAQAETALDATRIARLINAISIDFGSLGEARLSDFSRPERVWWSNPQAICARYRIAAAGHPTLEAVLDIHAYAADFALVEVVAENAKMTTASPIKPVAASYSAARISVNGSLVDTVNGNAGPEGTHAAFRSWHRSRWVGGDPRLRVTQAVTDLQRHPLFWKMVRSAGADLSAYATDAYTPWSTGRHRAAGMGGTGDASSIGPLPKWEAQFLQSGDHRAARAVEASALAVLGYNVNYRDAVTGLVPTFSELAGKSQQTNWPRQTNASDAMMWEVAHHPAAGLMAFICRPSPVYIELAQKVAIWNGTWSTATNNASFPVTTGVFGQTYQGRGWAWCMRSLGHAVFLTPDALPWKAAGQTAISNNVAWLGNFMTDAKATLNCTFGECWYYLVSGQPGTQFFEPVWFHQYLTTELHKLASARMLTGSAQTALDALADWCALQPVRWVNEQPDGGWRYMPYELAIGKDARQMLSEADWGAQMRWWYGTGSPTPGSQPSGPSGPISTATVAVPRSYGDFFVDTAAGGYYPSYWWAALCAARERGVAGAATAWQTVQSNATNLSTWLDGFATDPRWGAVPRNV